MLPHQKSSDWSSIQVLWAKSYSVFLTDIHIQSDTVNNLEWKFVSRMFKGTVEFRSVVVDVLLDLVAWMPFRVEKIGRIGIVSSKGIAIRFIIIQRRMHFTSTRRRFWFGLYLMRPENVWLTLFPFYQWHNAASACMTTNGRSNSIIVKIAH